MIDEIRKYRLRGQEIPISSRIDKLTITYSPGFSLRAVVITEHRNLDFNVLELRPYTQNVMFLQVRSYHSLHGPISTLESDWRLPGTESQGIPESIE